MSPWETPAALRDALEARLAAQALDSGLDLNRLRRRAVFERLLYRLEAAEPGRFVLKGGVALEVRLGRPGSRDKGHRPRLPGRLGRWPEPA